MAHEDLTTELQRPMGPDGYIVIAQQLPSFSTKDDWARQHVVAYHDWDWEAVSEETNIVSLETRHMDEHVAYEEGRGELPYPHTHAHDGLEYAIAQSELPRGIKNGWLETLRRLGDEASVPPEER